MDITFYSTHCPKCKVLESKLKNLGLEYTEIDNVDAMLKLGIKTAPVLKVDGKMMDFMTANRFLKEVQVNGVH